MWEEILQIPTIIIFMSVCNEMLEEHVLVLHRVCEARYSQERRIIKVLHEYLVVDGRRHENDLKVMVRLQQFTKFEQEEVAVNRAFMNL